MQFDDDDKKELMIDFNYPQGNWEDWDLADKLWLLIPNMCLTLNTKEELIAVKIHCQNIFK